MVFRINFGKNTEKISLKAVLLAKSQAVCSNVNKNAPSKKFWWKISREHSCESQRYWKVIGKGTPLRTLQWKSSNIFLNLACSCSNYFLTTIVFIEFFIPLFTIKSWLTRQSKSNIFEVDFENLFGWDPADVPRRRYDFILWTSHDWVP